MKKQITIYKTKSGKIKVRFNPQKNTVWLNQKQISQLFETDRSSITKHINNIFKTHELSPKSNVQKMHIANSDKPVNFYDLDTIISIGYRVNSKKATKFRIWATTILKKYITKGFVSNRKRLSQLQKTIKLISLKSHTPPLKAHQTEIIELIDNYASSLDLLKQYDSQNIEIPKLSKKIKYRLSYSTATEIIRQIKHKLRAPPIFGQEYPHKLNSIIKNLNQTFDSQELYSNIEKKASHLLYFIIKDHPFIDGNKRIASTLFIYFLSKNNHLHKTNGEIKINDRALVALALLIATSKPKEKDIMINLTINLIK